MSNMLLIFSYLIKWMFCSVVEFNSLQLKWCKSRPYSALLLILYWSTKFGHLHPSRKGGAENSGSLKFDKAVLLRGVTWWTERLLARNALVLAECGGLAHSSCATGRWERGQSNTRAAKRCDQSLVAVLFAAASSRLISARAEAKVSASFSNGGTQKAFYV